MAKKKAPAYSKYQQWADAGRPYWTGVGLANSVPGFAHLKRTLNARESPYNCQKLDIFLRQHMEAIPAEPLNAEEAAAVARDEAAATAPKPHAPAPPPPAEPQAAAPTATPKVVKLKGGQPVIIDNAISRLGPEVPAAWSDSKLALPSFAELPDVLKKGRVESNEKRRRASALHDQLAEGIADKVLRRDVCTEIVQLMDEVSAQYDAEREWKLNGVAPLPPDNIRQQLEAMDIYTLQQAITNRLGPRRSRWKLQLKLRDGDALVEAKLRYNEADAELLIAREVLRQKEIAHRVEMEQRDRERDARKSTRR